MKPQPGLSHLSERFAEQLHQLWLICNAEQRDPWLASLPPEDAALLKTYHAVLRGRGVDPEKRLFVENVDEDP